MKNKILALVRNVKIKCSFESADILDNYATDYAIKILKKSYRGTAFFADAFVYKKSVDARNRNEIFLVYTIAIPVEYEVSDKKIKGIDFLVSDNNDNLFLTEKSPKVPPLVADFGPSGMFCALALARAGLCPVVIERGADVDERAAAVEKYWRLGKLDTETNVQFGEGGAGTFSDGKLLTRISDRLCNYVLSQFVSFGAPKEIMYLAKPHIGTDNLRIIVKNIRNEIIRLGGRVLFNTKLESVISDATGGVRGVVLANGDKLACDSLFLCIGHSARDTVKNLICDRVVVEPKPFSVGLRIEHLQADIDRSLYGNFAGAPALGVSQYTLSKKVDGRAVYSFCMCPGGIVVASASNNGQIVTNGMSNYARDGLNANSAIAVSVNPQDYGNTVSGAIDFQASIENKAYLVGGNNGAAPIQLLGDFMNGVVKNSPSRIIPTYTGKTCLQNADDVFPSFITKCLRQGISLFEKDIEGFNVTDAVLTFPETRTSSPVKIPRDTDYLAIGFSNLYPCGEGAGYAGGITSAAVDGLRAAIAYLNN